MPKNNVIIAVALTLGLTSPTIGAATLEEKIQILEQELEALKAELRSMKDKPVAEPPAAGAPAISAAPAAASGTTSSSAAPGRTTIGGYGELHYNNFRDATVKDELDFHRFVLYFGHRFTDRLRFHSEVEYEHSVTGGGFGGETELEQAYIDYRLNDKLNLKTGIMLMPLGILNETHEPPTFFGIERNQVETRILPTTWWEGGVGVYGQLGAGFGYDVGVVSSFDISRFNSASSPLRRPRQKVSEAAVNDLGFYGALNYRRPGLQVGAGAFSGNSAQNGTRGATAAVRGALAGLDARVTLWDVHALYSLGDLDLRALYARGKIGDAAQVTTALRLDPASANVKVPENVDGWYAEAGYHLWRSSDKDLAPFVRYERYDAQKSLPLGLARDANTQDKVLTYGLNFKLHPQVVLKADYRNFKNDNRSDSFSLGVGYMF